MIGVDPRSIRITLRENENPRAYIFLLYTFILIIFLAGILIRINFSTCSNRAANRWGIGGAAEPVALRDKLRLAGAPGDRGLPGSIGEECAALA
jgi:hypothetical protein